jgi:hypothetical protein
MRHDELPEDAATVVQGGNEQPRLDWLGRPLNMKGAGNEGLPTLQWPRLDR